MKMRDSLIAAAGLAVMLGAVSAQAGTVAYWNFEQGVNGANVAHAGADGAFDGTVTDMSGNGNHLSAFTQGGYAGYVYRNLTPSATTPQTAAANTLSVQNSGGFPALFSSPTGTSVAGGTDLRTLSPTAWTIEASYKPENNNGYRTIVGRDGKGLATAGGDNNAAPLYFQLTPDNRFRVSFFDAAGVSHSATSSNTITDGYSYNGANPDGYFGASAGVFHNYAAVSDGSTLKIYVDGVEVGSTALTGSANTALSNALAGQASGGGWTAGEFTVGRGLYNGNHGDRAYGLIDDVRISDSALSTTQFLSNASAVPEPGSVALLGLAAVGLIGKRRR